MAQANADPTTPRPTLRAPILFLEPAAASQHVRRFLDHAARELGPATAAVIRALEPFATAELQTILASAHTEPQHIDEAIEAHLAAAERLIARLDASEGDPDLEDGDDDEPDADGETSLGWPEMPNQTRAMKACVGWAPQQDLEQDNADSEPSLGWCIGGALGGTNDREQDCEDEGADADALGLAI